MGRGGCTKSFERTRTENFKIQRQEVRKEYKKAKRRWEEEWWLKLVDETKDAEVKGDIRRMYKTLRYLGGKDLQNIEEEFFSPEEFRRHFMKVSEDRYERDVIEIMRTASSTEIKDSPEAKAAAEEMEEAITFVEFERELANMKDGAAGVDNVSVSAVKALSIDTRKELYQCMMEQLATPVENWADKAKEGWVIPLHKKGARNELDNYRGVCLLPVLSRIMARILTSRIRKWAEKIEACGENQNGFREGRSTCDATQIILRIDEKTRRVFGKAETTGNKPGAVLLDITKAYPRVNRPLLWMVLENLGMTEGVIEVLKNLHEGTKYKVKGRGELSEEWLPVRGLREGCATSPILFNVYHAQAMRLAAKKLRAKAAEIGEECGLEWSWGPGNSLPPIEVKRALRSSTQEVFRLEESLFADDSTLLGWTEELAVGKETVKAEMMKFEEKCHNGKEEYIAFGSETANCTRMLGTLIGRKQDRAARIKRGYWAWSKVRRWLWKTKVSKRTKAIIVQAVVESTMLFDCSARAWTVTDMAKMQSMADKCYRWIWNEGRGLTLLRMEREGVNSFEIRRVLGITSIRTKIETRALERMGHVLRMSNNRTTKKVILGHWTNERTQQGRLNGGVVNYWRRLIREAGEDWTNIENLTQDRKKWKATVKRRKEALEKWESEMCRYRGGEKPRRSQARYQGENLTCRWEGCGRICKTKGGLVQHERRVHRIQERVFKCDRCNRTFAEKHNLTNHSKSC